MYLRSAQGAILVLLAFALTTVLAAGSPRNLYAYTPEETTVSGSTHTGTASSVSSSNSSSLFSPTPTANQTPTLTGGNKPTQSQTFNSTPTANQTPTLTGGNVTGGGVNSTPATFTNIYGSAGSGNGGTNWIGSSPSDAGAFNHNNSSGNNGHVNIINVVTTPTPTCPTVSWSDPGSGGTFSCSGSSDGSQCRPSGKACTKTDIDEMYQRFQNGQEVSVQAAQDSGTSGDAGPVGQLLAGFWNAFGYLTGGNNTPTAEPGWSSGLLSGDLFSTVVPPNLQNTNVPWLVNRSDIGQLSPGSVGDLAYFSGGSILPSSLQKPVTVQPSSGFSSSLSTEGGTLSSNTFVKDSFSQTVGASIAQGLAGYSGDIVNAIAASLTPEKDLGSVRGIRNNNPGNITCSDISWDGEVGGCHDGDFEQFSTAEYGIRAATLNLINKADKHGYDTLTEIISDWSPAEDGNNTAAYIATLSAKLGVGPNEHLDLHDPVFTAKLLTGIISVEDGGVPYTSDQMVTGMNMAFDAKGISSGNTVLVADTNSPRITIVNTGTGQPQDTIAFAYTDNSQGIHNSGLSAIFQVFGGTATPIGSSNGVGVGDVINTIAPLFSGEPIDQEALKQDMVDTTVQFITNVGAQSAQQTGGINIPGLIAGVIQSISENSTGNNVPVSPTIEVYSPSSSGVPGVLGDLGHFIGGLLGGTPTDTGTENVSVTINDDKHDNGYTGDSVVTATHQGDVQVVGSVVSNLLGGVGDFLYSPTKYVKELLGGAPVDSAGNAQNTKEIHDANADLLGALGLEGGLDGLESDVATNVNDLASNGVDPNLAPVLTDEVTAQVGTVRKATLADQLKEMAKEKPELGLTEKEVDEMEAALKAKGYTLDQLAGMTAEQAQALNLGVDPMKYFDLLKTGGALGCNLFGCAKGSGGEALKEYQANNPNATIGEFMTQFQNSVGVTPVTDVITFGGKTAQLGGDVWESDTVYSALKNLPFTYSLNEATNNAVSAIQTFVGGKGVISPFAGSGTGTNDKCNWLCEAALEPFGGVEGARNTLKGIVAEQSTELSGSSEDEVVQSARNYLWEHYKPDATTRAKDEKAAAAAGMSLKDYVIGGVNPEMAVLSAHAGQAMEKDGVPFVITSAYRDDYRQSLVSTSGPHAAVGNSWHGGSNTTGGYGNGLAIDIAGTKAQQWIDENGADYGLTRPYIKNGDVYDAPHVALASSPEAHNISSTRDGHGGLSDGTVDTLYQQVLSSSVQSTHVTNENSALSLPWNVALGTFNTIFPPPPTDSGVAGVGQPVKDGTQNGTVNTGQSAPGVVIHLSQAWYDAIFGDTGTRDSGKKGSHGTSTATSTATSTLGSIGGFDIGGLFGGIIGGLFSGALSGFGTDSMFKSSPIGGVLGSFFDGIINIFGDFAGSSGSSAGSPGSSSNNGQTTPPRVEAGVTLIPSPIAVNPGSKALLTWAGTGVDACSVYDPDGNRIAHGGASGSVTTLQLGHSSVFRVACRVPSSGSIVSSQTTVVVFGDTATPMQSPLPRNIQF